MGLDWKDAKFVDGAVPIGLVENCHLPVFQRKQEELRIAGKEET